MSPDEDHRVGVAWGAFFVAFFAFIAWVDREDLTRSGWQLLLFTAAIILLGSALAIRACARLEGEGLRWLAINWGTSFWLVVAWILFVFSDRAVPWNWVLASSFIGFFLLAGRLHQKMVTKKEMQLLELEEAKRIDGLRVRDLLDWATEHYPPSVYQSISEGMISNEAKERWGVNDEVASGYASIVANEHADMVVHLREEQERRTKQTTMDQIDQLDPKPFEAFIGNLFRKMGYTVEDLPYVGDYGADLLAKRNEETIVIQCKKNSPGNNVGAPEVQKTAGAILKYKAAKAVVVTTSDFTVRAVEQARGTPVELWNREALWQLVKEVEQKSG